VSHKNWERIQAVFEEAIQHEPAGRRAFLVQACAGDAALRAAVDELLAHDAAVERAGFIKAPSRENVFNDANSGQTNEAAKQQGAPAGYEIVGNLGGGGMGIVYKAIQTKLKRPVALKMILAGAHAGPEELARFRREAETVARLEHPNIVHVYDYGDQEGLLYISMEYVDGGTLASNFKGEPQPVRQSAQLAEILARAMHWAHQRGIIHRDLKPANVLLTAHAVPKITDFGLAKLMDDGPCQTRSGAVLGTPSYMAPEQALGRPKEIGPATDVYALGVILYEMLTGRPPFKADTASETLEQVRSQEPVSVSKLLPKVPRDLETICSKCLQKRPAERYATAEALADDLRRFLLGEPILARPAPAWRRLCNWTKRHPTAAALIGVGALSLGVLGAAAITIAQLEHRRAVEADALRMIADQRRAEAEESSHQAREALSALFEAANRELGTRSGIQAIRKKLLIDVLNRARQLPQLAHDPEAQMFVGTSAQAVGLVINETGNLSEALEVYGEARALFVSASRAKPWDLVCLNKLAATYYSIGRLLQELGRLNEALQSHEHALNVWQKIVQEKSARRDWYRRNVAVGHYATAIVYLDFGRLAQAQSCFEESSSIMEQILKKDPSNEDALKYRTLIDFNLGLLHDRMHQPDEALRFLRKARDAWPKLVEASRGDIWKRRDLAKTDLYLGIEHEALGRRDQALVSLDRARTSLDQLVAENEEVWGFRLIRAEVHLNIGKIRAGQGRYAEATANLEKSSETCRALLRDNPNIIQTLAILAESHSAIAGLRRAQGQLTTAIGSLQEAQRIWQGLVTDHPDIPRFRSALENVRKGLLGLQEERLKKQSK
jgi:eukaryotic-like serine/threonine-protein kinase